MPLSRSEAKLNEMYHILRLGEHPHLVRFLEAWEQRGYLNIRTEYCSRGRYDVQPWLARAATSAWLDALPDPRAGPRGGGERALPVDCAQRAPAAGYPTGAAGATGRRGRAAHARGHFTGKGDRHRASAGSGRGSARPEAREARPLVRMLAVVLCLRRPRACVTRRGDVGGPGGVLCGRTGTSAHAQASHYPL